MKIVIVGCGKIGKSLIASLVKEGHEVVAVDKSEQKVADVINMFDVIGVCGIGTDAVTLTEAGADKADIFVAVTGSDEMNMLSCFWIVLEYRLITGYLMGFQAGIWWEVVMKKATLQKMTSHLCVCRL